MRGHGEGSVNQDKRTGRWRAELMVGTSADGKRLRWRGAWHDKRGDARDELTRARADLLKGTLVVGPRQTVAEYLAVYLRDSAAPRLRPRTLESYTRMLEMHALPELGHLRLDKVTPAHLRALYRQKLDEGLSPRSVQYLHAILRRALRDAERDGVLPRNVAAQVDPPRSARPEQRALTATEGRTLAAAAMGDSLEALYLLALTSGMRQGELLGLQWQDIDWEQSRLAVQRSVSHPHAGGWMFVEPKSKTSRRSVPIHPAILLSLKRHKARQNEQRLSAGSHWEDHDLIFASAVGTPLNPTNLIRKSFRPLLEKAGLRRVRFHDLRHSTATLLFAGREHPKNVQQLLGHSQITTTMDTYSHAVPGMDEEMVGRLGRVLDL